MLETLLAVYAASVFVFFMMNLWTASEAVKLSSSARGKEIKQFYKGVASDRLGLLKWFPLRIVTGKHKNGCGVYSQCSL